MVEMRCGSAAVGSSIEVAATFGKRFLGLMFRKSLPEGGGMLLLPCGSIHMCFMRMRLDIAYTDGSLRVLAVENSLKPWRVGKYVKGAKAVLELPDGTLERCGIAPGDQLTVYLAQAHTRKIDEKGKKHGYERKSACIES
jgi:uncharacterized protein